MKGLITEKKGNEMHELCSFCDSPVAYPVVILKNRHTGINYFVECAECHEDFELIIREEEMS